MVFELDNAPCETPDDCYVEFLDKPNVDGPVHPMEGEIKGFDDWTAMYGDFMPHDVKIKTKGSKVRNRDQTLAWCGLHVLYYYMRNFCNLIGLEQWYFSLIRGNYMEKLQTFYG